MKTTPFTDADISQIREHGLDVETVQEQIAVFRRGFKPAHLVRPCTVGDGILRLDPSRLQELILEFQSRCRELEIFKFVPASGAATRMFRDLHGLYEAYRLNEAPLTGEMKVVRDRFFQNLKRFAFYEHLRDVMQRDGLSPEHCLKEGHEEIVLEYLLTSRGLSYGSLPKGLIPFHRYQNDVRTPVEEHLVEAAVYARGRGNVARLHFTVAPLHEERFRRHVAAAVRKYENKTCRYHVEFSVQDPATDTIAVDFSNRPFRDDAGRLVFRPGGHGALLRNLNALAADLIYIKNIDNVTVDRLKEPTYQYKQALGALLLRYRDKIHEFIQQLRASAAPATIDATATWVFDELEETPPGDWKDRDHQARRTWLLDFLNRPIRVCGMVPHAGQPGGGPFWVIDSRGQLSRQIVETAQIDMNSPDQRRIWEASTHFNPVDIVCSIQNYDGGVFDLHRYVDPAAYFITEKSYQGRPLKALEHPGLWNGSMAYWITIFVEVPADTFTPVKTVFDLLSPSHQGEG